MPELPEVETTRRGLAPYVERQKVTAVRLYDRRLRWVVPQDLPKYLIGRTIDRIDRRSKYLLFRLGPDTLIVHLGMTGSLRVHRDRPPKGVHDHIDIEFDNGVVLRYHDPRRFGAVLWSPHSEHVHPLLSKLGPEPFSRGVRCRLPPSSDPQARCRDQTCAHGQSPRRRRREHLRQRSLVPRRNPPDPAGESHCARAPRAARERRFARRCPTRSARAAARCATTSIAPVSPDTSNSTIASMAAQGNRAASAAPPFAPRGSADAVPPTVTSASAEYPRLVLARFMLESHRRTPRNGRARL